MISLEKLVKELGLFGYSDEAIIKAWFVENGKEIEGVEMINALIQAKLEKDRQEMTRMVWAPMLPSKYLYETYSLDIADRLHNIELEYITYGEVKSTNLEWAKENFPKIKEPQAYFNPCKQWLEEKGIFFKKKGRSKKDDG